MSRRPVRSFLLLLFLLPSALLIPVTESILAQQPDPVFEPGDSLCIIGNTLAERMQHDGWLETLLQTRLKKDLVIRNLGFSADELDLRLRSRDFGSPDQWLTKLEADVIFAFFGYNESFAGKSGVAGFEQKLDRFIKNTLSKKYNGRSAPRLVLFSPIACEDLRNKTPDDPADGLNAVNPNLADVDATNRRLGVYVEAMKKVAATNQVPIVDLFAATQPVFETPDQYTINGIHLNNKGNAVVAELVCDALFGQPTTAVNAATVTAVNQAVRDKNFHWFHRYRTTDGYSTYGGRADLKFTDGQTNREVVQRELEVLDFMTAEREKKVHALVAGSDYQPDDSSAPNFIPVISNKPGDGPDGKHLFLSGDEAIDTMTLHPGMEVNLFASEEQFPELASPVQMSFDTRGRLWVAAWPTYPHWQPIVEEMNDKLLIFSDTDSDGKADDMKVFADKLHNPTGFEFWGGGVLVAQIPDLLFLKDTDGDDVADVRIKLLHGLDSADTHHAANSFVIGPGGALYFQEGTFHHTQIERPGQKPLRVVNGGVYRFDPRTFKLDAYTSYGFANPHGHVFDDWGQDFITDGTGNVNYYATPFTGHVEYPQKHSRYFPFFQQWVRPAGATEILSSTHFPDEFQGNYMIVNVIGFQGILHYTIKDDGSGFSGHRAPHILTSEDPNFRPVDIEMGPDGAIYILDWQNPIIGHMQHNLRDPNRDKVHGRVYRVTWKDRPLLKVKDLTAMSIPQLLDELKGSVSRERYRARIELSGRDSAEVLAATTRWVSRLDPQSPNHTHDLLEALWVSQQHNQVNKELLNRLLNCDDYRARAAATRVVCYCRDQLDNPLNLLQARVNDQHARVRLEAIRALSFLPSARAAEIALQSLNYPSDKFISYCLNETLRSMEKIVNQHVAEKKPFAEDNPAGLRMIMSRMDPSRISSMRPGKIVFQEQLSRVGILHETRIKAAEGLAALNDTDSNIELLNAIDRLDKSNAADAQTVLADLTHVFLHGDGKGAHGGPRDIDFSKYQSQLDALATQAKRQVTRQVAYATLAVAESSVDRLWASSLENPAKFSDLVSAMALIDDEELKKKVAPKVAGLLKRLPVEIEQRLADSKSVNGRFVRIELPGNHKTLTLAEVQIISGGDNIATQGTATQSSTSHGGVAARAIDGNTSSSFNDGGQTHTIENRNNPWWELDLGSSKQIEGILIWNRADGLGDRLQNFGIKVLDDDRNVVFHQRNQPAPKPNVQLVLGADPRGAIRKAAIKAAVHLVPGETSTFEAFADFILKNESRRHAVQGMARLPKRSWVESRIRPVVGDIVARVSALPASVRTQPEVVDEISLGKKLAAALPAEEARVARTQLNDLGINVVVLRPVPHRMQYDKVNFFVEAGKPFQLILDNTDIMPHNVVITQPGAYAKVGIAAEMMATRPDAGRRQYVPNMPEIIHASKMLQPSQLERMDLTAPAKVGEYPYVCTYPGHWRRMYGVMHVVEDLDQAPIESLVPTVDADIAKRPFVREWKMDDLRDGLAAADVDRNFERGRALFTELSCAQCHQLGDSEGGDVGPNLLDLQAKFRDGTMDRVGLLKSLIEPSETIDEKYRSWIILDLDGKTYTGVIAERTEDEIRLLANPLDNGKAVTIPIDDIDEEIKSKISMMPQGLLNTCTQQEILDLLMFIESAGKEDHPSFKK